MIDWLLICFYVLSVNPKNKERKNMINKLNVPRLETIKQAARVTNLAPYYIRQLVLQNKIKYVRAGRKYLVNLDNLIEYLSNGEMQNANVEQGTNINKISKVGK
ncbi:MAG: excisionase family DNA-binding protein [Candidatus Gastranaerophilales bacterium]|nr:excisionase family DNA-binding protein [Candidatus Gastranaerophilales bacterium]